MASSSFAYCVVCEHRDNEIESPLQHPRPTSCQQRDAEVRGASHRIAYFSNMLQQLPHELLLHVLSFLPAPLTSAQNARHPDLSRLSRCSRLLYAVLTPVLYASIAVEDEMPLLLRSLIRHPHLRSYTHSLTLSLSGKLSLSGRISEREAYFRDYADAKLLRKAIEETLQDDVWHQPPPEGWCRGKLHAKGFGAQFGTDAAWRWFAAATSLGEGWNAQCALLLALLPGLTRLEIRTNAAPLQLFHTPLRSVHPSVTSVRIPLRVVEPPNGPDCMAFLMLAAANTQLRALAAAADPAHAPQDSIGSNPADGVLARLRYVSITGWSSLMQVEDLLLLALPPLLEELRVGQHQWGTPRKCDNCALEMNLNLRNLAVLDNMIPLMSRFRDLLYCFPKLEKLVGCPGCEEVESEDDSEEPLTMLEALDGAVETLKELDMSEDVWPHEVDPEYRTPGGPLCDFPALEKLSISAERQMEYWQTQQNARRYPVPAEQMLLGQFPASLKELTITSKSQARVLEIVPALSYLLATHEEVPALQRVTVGLAERHPEHEALVNVRRRCAARQISLALPFVQRMQDYQNDQKYQSWFADETE